nr:metallothionein-like protein type 2 [Ipomoea trifida]
MKSKVRLSRPGQDDGPKLKCKMYPDLSYSETATTIETLVLSVAPMKTDARENDDEGKQRRRRKKVKSVVKGRRRKVKPVVKGR